MQIQIFHLIAFWINVKKIIPNPIRVKPLKGKEKTSSVARETKYITFKRAVRLIADFSTKTVKVRWQFNGMLGTFSVYIPICRRNILQMCYNRYRHLSPLPLYPQHPKNNYKTGKTIWGNSFHTPNKTQNKASCVR